MTSCPVIKRRSAIKTQSTKKLWLQKRAPRRLNVPSIMAQTPLPAALRHVNSRRFPLQKEQIL